MDFQDLPWEIQDYVLAELDDQSKINYLLSLPFIPRLYLKLTGEYLPFELENIEKRFQRHWRINANLHQLVDLSQATVYTTEDVPFVGIQVRDSITIPTALGSRTIPLNTVRLNLPGLDEFPEQIRFLQDLQILRIVRSQLPDQLILPNLVTLDLSYNDLTSLPEVIILPKLKSLDLSYNKLISLPDNLHLPSLQTLRLDNNQLKDIPRTMDAPQMRVLNISNNPLRNPINLQRLIDNNSNLQVRFR